MFHNAVVGVDGGESDRDAIALARVLLSQSGSLGLAHVHGGDPRMRVVSPDIAGAERARSKELLESVRSREQIDALLLSTGSLSVGRGLHEIVERHGADLLVVGSHSRSLLGRVMVSDHLGDALNGIPSAIAIAPGGYADRPPVTHEIGVGYDGSPESEHALAVAIELAKELGTKVSAFEAVSLPLGHRGDSATIERLVEDARARIAAVGDVEPHAAFGHAAEELALYGASLDLLVIGSRGYGPISRFVHGSTSRHLARIARCPLLVLTRAAQAGEELPVAEPGEQRHAVAGTGSSPPDAP